MRTLTRIVELVAPVSNRHRRACQSPPLVAAARVPGCLDPPPRTEAAGIRGRSSPRRKGRTGVDDPAPPVAARLRRAASLQDTRGMGGEGEIPGQTLRRLHLPLAAFAPAGTLAGEAPRLKLCPLPTLLCRPAAGTAGRGPRSDAGAGPEGPLLLLLLTRLVCREEGCGGRGRGTRVQDVGSPRTVVAAGDQRREEVVYCPQVHLPQQRRGLQAGGSLTANCQACVRRRSRWHGAVSRSCGPLCRRSPAAAAAAGTARVVQGEQCPPCDPRPELLVPLQSASRARSAETVGASALQPQRTRLASESLASAAPALAPSREDTKPSRPPAAALDPRARSALLPTSSTGTGMPSRLPAARSGGSSAWNVAAAATSAAQRWTTCRYRRLVVSYTSITP